MEQLKRGILAGLILIFISGLRLNAQQGSWSAQLASAEQLFAMANQSRVQVGEEPLQWDPALAAAALKHCQKMAAEGNIAHRYGDEPDLGARTAAAGAHFSLIEENVAVGPHPEMIHQAWLRSPGHRDNLLNREVDHVGIAVVATQNALYAVADYAHTVPEVTPAQAETAVAGLIRTSGVAVRADHTDARAACVLDRGLPRHLTGGEPQFVMRWQDSDLEHLPRPLIDRLSSGRFRQADVGSCPALDTDGTFTTYRFAVILY